MDTIREGSSTIRPPILDGTNYTYWKVRMIAFLKSMDNKTWKAVMTGWEHPTMTDVTGKVLLKPESCGQMLKMKLCWEIPTL